MGNKLKTLTLTSIYKLWVENEIKVLTDCIGNSLLAWTISLGATVGDLATLSKVFLYHAYMSFKFELVHYKGLMGWLRDG